MRKQLIVHIGANKTGSSSIQRFLSLNCLDLRDMGVIVPSQDFAASDKVSGFHVFGFADLLKDASHGRTRLEASVDALFEHYPDAQTILLTAENLAADPLAPGLFAGLVERFDVRVIVYVRRQDEYILSSWQQWNSKISDDFWAWLISSVGQLGNWQAYLEQWETVVSRERISVRVFEREKLVEGDVVRDFYEQLHLSAPFNDLRYPDSRVNPSFSDAITELVMGNELLFKNAHDNDFYNLIRDLTGDKYVKDKRQSPITFAQRKAILGRYVSSNRWVRDTYLPDLRTGLFSAARESDYDFMTSDGLRLQQLQFLTTMTYLTHQKAKP